MEVDADEMMESIQREIQRKRFIRNWMDVAMMLVVVGAGVFAAMFLLVATLAFLVIAQVWWHQLFS